jgi:rubrerythrin
MKYEVIIRHKKNTEKDAVLAEFANRIDAEWFSDLCRASKRYGEQYQYFFREKRIFVKAKVRMKVVRGIRVADEILCGKCGNILYGFDETICPSCGAFQDFNLKGDNKE